MLFVNKIEFYFINFIIEFAVIFNGLNIKIIKKFLYKTGGRIDLNQDVVDILIYQFANCFGDQYFSRASLRMKIVSLLCVNGKIIFCWRAFSECIVYPHTVGQQRHLVCVWGVWVKQRDQCYCSVLLRQLLEHRFLHSCAKPD